MAPKEIVQRLIGNAAFVNACELHFRKIMQDGKLTASDIPYFILILGTVNQYRGRIKFNDAEIAPVIRELSIALFDKFDVFANDSDRDAAIASMDMLLPLVEMSVNLMKGNCCSCFRPDTSEHDMTSDIHRIVDSKAEPTLLESKDRV